MINITQLTKNFSLEELIKSQVAIRRGISNMPNEGQFLNLKLLCDNVLQPLREWYDKPVFISSGFRSLALNAAIGGSASSQHCDGYAADLDVGRDNVTLFTYIKNVLDFDQLIWENGDETNPAWVHVSFCKENRKQVLKIKIVNGRKETILME